MSRPANDLSIEHIGRVSRFKLHFKGYEFEVFYPRYKTHRDINNSIKEVVREMERRTRAELSVSEYGALMTLLVDEYKRHFDRYRRYDPSQPLNSVNSFGEQPPNKKRGGSIRHLTHENHHKRFI